MMNSLLNILQGLLQAPEAQEAWLFKNEKINTVIVVVMVIWTVVAAYLLLSGLKLRKLEKQVAEIRDRHNQMEGERVEETTIEIQNKRS